MEGLFRLGFLIYHSNLRRLSQTCFMVVVLSFDLLESHLALLEEEQSVLGVEELRIVVGPFQAVLLLRPLM